MKRVVILYIILVLVPSSILAEELIIDNLDPAFSTTGSWVSEEISVHSSSFNSSDYLKSKKKDAIAKWDTSQSSGEYEVFVMFASVFSYSRSAVYEVHHAGGITTVAMDHSRDGGLWHSLGTFVDPDRIVLSNGNSDGSVSADAIKLIKIEEEPPVVCESGNGGGAGGHFSRKKAYFGGTHSYYHPTANYYCRSRMYIANVTNEAIQVTITVYNSEGNVILDDGSASTGRFRLDSSIPTEYTDDGPVVLTLSPRQSVQFTMYEVARGKQDYEHGEITWSAADKSSSAQVAVLANASVYCDEYGSATKQAWREVSINAGLPF